MGDYFSITVWICFFSPILCVPKRFWELFRGNKNSSVVVFYLLKKIIAFFLPGYLESK